ncbi:MAG: hypothetical protein J5764_06250 [Bacteroidales bacterium]|nr:hypothetical protein [Bacteroidales bacterium]
MTEYSSKHGTVSRPREQLYMAFTDMRFFRDMLPEDKKSYLEADYDTLRVTVQGFTIEVKVVGREPYSRIELANGAGAPFAFNIILHFNEGPDASKTDFQIVVEADLNFVMKTMLGPKIKEGLDKIVDGLVDVSEGRVPEGMPADVRWPEA